MQHFKCFLKTKCASGNPHFFSGLSVITRLMTETSGASREQGNGPSGFLSSNLAVSLSGRTLCSVQSVVWPNTVS
jgi:hypothetical protein